MRYTIYQESWRLYDQGTHEQIYGLIETKEDAIEQYGLMDTKVDAIKQYELTETKEDAIETNGLVDDDTYKARRPVSNPTHENVLHEARITYINI